MTLNVTFMLWRSFFIFFILRTSDLITTLSYVLMNNFCPCLFTNPSEDKYISIDKLTRKQINDIIINVYVNR